VPTAIARKSANLRRSPKVSLTINKDWAGWKKVRGLSMGATAKILERPADTRRAHALLARKFKDMKGLSAEDMAATVFVRVQPKVVSLLDYRRGFGWTKAGTGVADRRCLAERFSWRAGFPFYRAAINVNAGPEFLLY